MEDFKKGSSSNWYGDSINANDLYRLLLESAEDAIVIMNSTGIVDCNSSAVKLFRAGSKEELTKLSLMKLSPEEQPNGVNSNSCGLIHIRQAISGYPQRFYWKLQRLDGSLFDAEVTLSKISVEGGMFLHSIIHDVSNYIEIADASQNSEKMYKSIFNNVQDVFYQTDVNGIITLISPSIAHYTNYQPDDLTGLSIKELYSNPYDRDKLWEILNRDGQIVDYEVELRIGEGKTFFVSVNAHLRFDEKGGFIGVEGSLRDITERKSALDIATRQQIMLRTLIDNLPVMIYVKDSNGRKIIANKAEVSFLEKTREEEVIGKTDIELLGVKKGQKSYDQDMDVIQNGTPMYDDETTYVNSQGQVIWLRVTKIPLKEQDGQVVGIVGFSHDITNDVESGRALKESEEKYRTLFASIPDGVYRSTPDGRFVEANPALVKILGYDNLEELMAIDIKKDLYFDIQDRESAILLEMKEEMAIYPLRKKDGTKIWVEDHGWLATDDNGAVLFNEGVLRDVTERYKFQLQLEQFANELKLANETKDKLFSIIAHDLLSPFNAMLGFTELLGNNLEDLSPDDRAELIRRLHTTAKNTYTLLEKLLTWSRSQRGKILVHKEHFQLFSIVGEIRKSLIEVAAAKEISIKNNVVQQFEIFGDPSMINVIVYNLVANAIKFSYKRGIVNISAHKAEKEFIISVSDNGVGMSSDKVEALFSSVLSQSTPGTANEKGTGLGLIICKEFVEKQGGKIWIDSRPGHGSVFSFSLPFH